MIFNETLMHDLKFTFPHEKGIKFYGHYPVLVARAPYFSQQVESLDLQQGEVPIKYCTSATFLRFLNYLYTDTLEFHELREIAEFLDLCDFYQLSPHVFQNCEVHLDNILSSSNAASMYMLATARPFSPLFAYIHGKVAYHIRCNLDEVVKSESWHEIPHEVKEQLDWRKQK